MKASETLTALFKPSSNTHSMFPQPPFVVTGTLSENYDEVILKKITRTSLNTLRISRVGTYTETYFMKA